MRKPLEFWIEGRIAWTENDLTPKVLPESVIHVREVIPLSQEEIQTIMTELNIPVKHQIGFADGLAYATRKND